MKRLLPLLLLAVLATGCRTTAMKGTPFYTGEHATREGPASDRVNLWPIAYYRAPALSVLWPIGEFSDDRFAVRPLFSMYRDGKDEPWHEYNWLGGLVSVDTETHDRVSFPFFWGEHYFNIFPLFWSGSDPDEDSAHNILFPLWVYSRKSNGDRVEFFPWPLAGHFLDGTESRWFVFPLWDRTLDRNDPSTFKDRFALFLAGNIGRGDDRQHWIVPFYYARKGGPVGDEFVSLPWASKGDAWRAIPLLLSAWSPDGARGRILLGLGGWEDSKSWAFPLFYRDSATGELVAPLCYRNPRTGVFLSPLWASKDGAWRCVPPLLSWWNTDGSGRALLGLAGWDDSRSWAVPFFYRDAASDTLVTPLWATQAGRWSAIPPLLSWRSADPATGESSLYLLGGLAGFEPDAHWFAPLYFRDEAKGLFVSLPYAQGRNWRAIPPLLSWWNADGSGRVLLGFAGWNADGSHWIFPLYHRDAENGRFVSLLYAQDRKWRGIPPLLTSWNDNGDFVSPLYAQGPGWGAIPPLLTWWNGRGGRALLGLGGWEPDRSWLVPFWYRDPECLLTPLWGRWHNEFQTDTYWATPLVGTSSGETTGSWFFPFWNVRWFHRGGDHYYHNFLLFAGARGGSNPDGRSSVWFWPLFSDDTDPKVDSLLAEMDAPRAPDRDFFRDDAWYRYVGPGVVETNPVVRPVLDRAREESSFLLGLGGSERSVHLNGGWWDLAGKLGAPLSTNGPLARFSNVRSWRSFDGNVADELFESIARGPVADPTNDVARYVAEDSDWLFPLWSHERTRGVMFDLPSGEKSLDAELETFSALLFLYDYRHESVPEENHDYARRRVLWRLYHYERLNGDESTDVFPAITYDRRKDGYRKFSFLWRFFRYERDPEKGTKLDVLFIPFRRPPPSGD